jgi:hypothetical protein
MIASEASEGITWWAVASAFGGTIIGGGISFFLQRLNLAEARKQRAKERFEARKALAYSLFFKMVRIHSSIVIIQKAIAESIAKAESAGFKGILWQKVIPFGNLPGSVKFVSDEMALVLSLDYDLFNAIGPFDDIHNSLIDLVSNYGQKRGAMMEKFGAKMSGGLGATTLTKEEAEWMAPRA